MLQMNSLFHPNCRLPGSVQTYFISRLILLPLGWLRASIRICKVLLYPLSYSFKRVLFIQVSFLILQSIKVSLKDAIIHQNDILTNLPVAVRDMHHTTHSCPQHLLELGDT